VLADVDVGCNVVSCRHFHLILRKSSAVLAHDFRVVAVNADNVERVVDIKPTMYHGYLAGASIYTLMNSV